MKREWLVEQFAAGKSLEQIGREQACHASTVGYWAARYGLTAPGAERFARRGPPDRVTLEELAVSGATLREMATAVDRSIATVRHWLARWEIERAPRQGRVPADQRHLAPRSVNRRCERHGLTGFVLEGRGYYRCKRCRLEAVSDWRRRAKLLLVDEAGGRCRLCGYDRCPAALQFHHVDPSQKSFLLSRQGVSRSLATAREEARKCVLLCANCHAEVEVGYSTWEGGIKELTKAAGLIS